MPAKGDRNHLVRDSEIVQRHRSGQKSGQIEREMNLTHSTVNCVLFRAGIQKVKDPLRREAIKSIAAQGGSGADIAKQYGLTSSTISQILSLPEENDLAVTPSIQVLRDEKEAMRKLFAKEARILTIFDPHSPHIYRPALDDALKAEGSFDLAIIGGDELDNVRYSRFRPDEAESVVDELKMASDVEDALRRKVPMVWKIRGNHDERLRKMILDHLTNLLPRMHKDAQKHMMKSIDKLELWHHDRSKEGIFYHAHHWLMTGNEDRPNVIAHPDRYTRAKYATVASFAAGLKERNFNPGSVCIGHLHRYGPWLPVAGVWLAEMPAMCQRLPYMEQASAGDQPHHVGYGVLVQDKHGRFVPNKSYVHFTAQL